MNGSMAEPTTLVDDKTLCTVDSDEKEKGETKNETSSFTFIPIAYSLLGNK